MPRDTDADADRREAAAVGEVDIGASQRCSIQSRDLNGGRRARSR